MASEKYNTYIRSNVWYAKSARFKAAAGGRCVMFPWMAAQVSHHLTYDNLHDEKFIRDCIPLSRFAHSLIHENSIGKYFWKDKLVRRRLMNFVLRVMAIVVTVYAKVVGSQKPKKKSKAKMSK